METLEKTLATIQKEPNKMNGAKKKIYFRLELIFLVTKVIEETLRKNALRYPSI